MKKFSVLSLVFVLFAVSTVVAQEEQASPSDAPVVATEVAQPVVQEAAPAVQEPVANDQSVVMMPVEGQAAPMASNGCCGSTVVQQPCCGQVQPACGCAPTCRRVMVRRPFFRRGWFRRGCCN